MVSLTKTQLEERAELNAAKTERAYAELAASVTPRGRAKPARFDDAERVDKAVKECLKYVGVKPGDAPKDIDDPVERIDWLCRTSGTMHRTVRLGKGWQKEAFGAMLGWLDTGEAVALIPRGSGGYWLLDPETDEKVKATSEVVARIDGEAVFFYKPLPSRPLVKGDLRSFVFGTFSRLDYLFAVAAAIVVAFVGLLPAWAYKSMSAHPPRRPRRGRRRF